MACLCKVATSPFRPYSAAYDVNIATEGLELELMETREVAVNTKEPISKGCRLSAKMNHIDAKRGIPTRKDMPTYYVKKRLTDRRVNRNLAMYQFHAARTPVVKTLDQDPRERDDPPEGLKPSATDENNQFLSELGFIYCERSTIKKLVLVTSQLTSKGCGIEETLVTLCLRDARHISPQGVETLDLNLEFDDIDDTGYHNPGLADSAVQMRELVRDQCYRLVRIELGFIPRNARAAELRTKQYLRGAQLANYEDVFVKQSDCNGIEWMVHETNYLLSSDVAFGAAFRNMNGNRNQKNMRRWYVCSRKFDMFLKIRIGPHLVPHATM
jgi:hypothetical protein